MSPRKLSDSDKKNILQLYHQPEETTSTLAVRYQVSSSTISRFLKSNLSETEYEELIQQKRLSRTPNQKRKLEQKTVEQPKLSKNDGSDEQTISLQQSPSKAESTKKTTPMPVVKTFSAQAKEELLEEEDDDDDDLNPVNVISLGDLLGEDLVDLDDEDLDDSNEDEWEDDIEDDSSQPIPKQYNIQVLPLSEASFPRICYLVIDRRAELITRPLKDFGDLGNIPTEEVQQITLPVFDNHRVARRFSNRSQRIIKVPDGRLLEKTCSYLEAKGITRLLMDGQVYSL